MKTSWKQSVEWILEDEGGYVDHPDDPGGATNHGITLATLREWRNDPTLDKWAVRALSKAEAKEIYRARYWVAIHGDALPAGIDYVVMDGAVHSGPTQSILWLQRALDVADDGRMGPITLEAAADVDPGKVVVASLELRMAMLRRLSTWPTYMSGWTKRIHRVAKRAPTLWRQGEPTFPIIPPAGDAVSTHTETPMALLRRGVEDITAALERLEEEERP